MKRNLLYIGNKLSNKGSTVTSIETLGNFLKAEGFDVTTASSKKNKILRMLDMLWHVWKFKKKNALVLIDTYSTQNFYYAVLVARLCRLRKLPYIPILRGGNLPERIKNSPGKAQKLFHNAKTNIAPSHYLMNAFTAEGYTNIIHIPNTIDISKYHFKIRHELKPRLLWVRSFAEIYNPTLAILILEQLRTKGIDASLTMVGPQKDASFEHCKALAKKNNVPVTFTGMLTKEAWIALSEKHDIFINTTNFDNTPVSVIEAMALGLPVVSTNVGGLPYLIEAGQDGILVVPNDVQVFVDAIEKLLANPAAAQSIAQKARDKVTQFDWKHVKHQWISLLSQ